MNRPKLKALFKMIGYSIALLLVGLPILLMVSLSLFDDWRAGLVFGLGFATFMFVLRSIFRQTKPKKEEFPMAKVGKSSDGGFTVSMNKEHGLVDGHHYTDCVEGIKQLKREGNHQQAIELLLKTIDATERESKTAGSGWGVAPWYYEQLAIIYRKDGRIEDEVTILERYARQEKAPGAGPERLKQRLLKAKSKLKKEANKSVQTRTTSDPV